MSRTSRGILELRMFQMLWATHKTYLPQIYLIQKIIIGEIHDFRADLYEIGALRGLSGVLIRPTVGTPTTVAASTFTLNPLSFKHVRGNDNIRQS